MCASLLTRNYRCVSKHTNRRPTDEITIHWWYIMSKTWNQMFLYVKGSSGDVRVSYIPPECSRSKARENIDLKTYRLLAYINFFFLTKRHKKDVIGRHAWHHESCLMAPEFYINESCKGTCRIYTSVTFLFDICGALKWETSHSFKENGEKSPENNSL